MKHFTTIAAIVMMAISAFAADNVLLDNIKREYETVPAAQKENFIAHTIVSYSSARITQGNFVRNAAKEIGNCAVYFKSGDERRDELKRISSELLDVRNRFYRVRMNKTGMVLLIAGVDMAIDDLNAVDTDDCVMASLVIPKIIGKLENVKKYVNAYDEIIEWCKQNAID